MAKKRKRKEVPVTVSYEIKVENWEVDYHLSLNIIMQDLIDGVFWESSQLILIGQLISPAIEKANKARIEIAAKPEMDDHWKQESKIVSAKAVGYMEIPRGEDNLIFHCLVPSRSMPFIATAVQSGKIKHVSLLGTKLKWRQGTISSLSLSTHKEDE
jgi:hypothetical protein